MESFIESDNNHLSVLPYEILVEIIHYVLSNIQYESHLLPLLLVCKDFKEIIWREFKRLQKVLVTTS